MEKATARRYLGTTIVACSYNGASRDEDYDMPGVILSIDPLWTRSYGRNSGVRRAHPTVKTPRARGYGFNEGATGWLLLTVKPSDYFGETREGREERRHLLQETADRLAASTHPAPDDLAEWHEKLPEGLEFDVFIPKRVHKTPFAKLREEIAAAREMRIAAQETQNQRLRRDEELAAEGNRYATALVARLGVSEPNLLVHRTGNLPALLPIIGLLERLAKAEGVEVPERPEGLRGL